MKRLLSALLLLFVATLAPLTAADLTITAANVVPSSSAVVAETTAGATIAAGQLLYLDANDLDVFGRGKAKLSDADGAAALRVVHGIAINSASAGQPVKYVTHDPALTVGGTQTPNTILILSGANAGGVAPAADLSTGEYLVVIGVVKTATVIFFHAPGLASGAAS